MQGPSSSKATIIIDEFDSWGRFWRWRLHYLKDDSPVISVWGLEYRETSWLSLFEINYNPRIADRSLESPSVELLSAWFWFVFSHCSRFGYILALLSGLNKIRRI